MVYIFVCNSDELLWRDQEGPFSKNWHGINIQFTADGQSWRQVQSEVRNQILVIEFTIL
jgi:hypothetical protein